MEVERRDEDIHSFKNSVIAVVDSVLAGISSIPMNIPPIDNYISGQRNNKPKVIFIHIY